MDDSGSHTGLFSKIFRQRSEETAEDEIVSILTEGQDQGTILESEAEMITNIFELDDIEASEIMTHRKNLSAIDGSWTLEDTIQFICRMNFSRFPVYKDNIDNIIGVLHIRDAMRAYMDESNRGLELTEIEDIFQKAYFIPETSKINTVFRNMQADKIHMGIVVDEYGQTAGIVAMEDIIEEIVGNIFDEHDVVEYNIIRVGENIYDVKGLTPLSEVEEELGIEYDDEDNDTLNGYLVSKLGRIPSDDIGTEIVDESVKYIIMLVEDKTIAQVRIIISREPDNDGD
ncbi:MAG: hemolysin family protein [Lachnospiraceae bacterium]|jgi:putative hemolysin